MFTKLPSYNFSPNSKNSNWQRFVASTAILNTKAPFWHFEVGAWGASITRSSEISLYTVQKIWWIDVNVRVVLYVCGCVIVVRNIWTVSLSHKRWLIMSNIRWVLNFLRTLNRPDCVSAFSNSMFPLGNKFSRKAQLTEMLVPLQSSIILRKNMVDSQFLQLNASFQSDHYHKTPYSKNGWKYTRPYHSLKFQEIFLWSIRAKRNHPDPLNTNPIDILIVWFTCWEKNVWLVDLPVPESSSGLNLLLPWAVFCVLQCFAFILRPFQE